MRLVLPRLRRDDMLLRPGGAVVWSVPGGMETWARVRSSAYGLMCGSLLPFSRRRGRVQALQNSAKAGGTHTRTREEAILYGFRQVSKIGKDRRTHTREEAMLFTFGHLSKSEQTPVCARRRCKRFWRILQKHFTRGTGLVFGRCQGITRSEIVRLRASV